MTARRDASDDRIHDEGNTYEQKGHSLNRDDSNDDGNDDGWSHEER